jgi:hypothetical protein
VHDCIAKHVEDWPHPLEVLLAAPDHDREGSLFGPRLPARYRGIEHPRASLLDFGGEFFRDHRRDGAHVHEQRAFPDPLENAIIPGDDLPDIRRVWEHCNDNVALLGHFSRACGSESSLFGQLVCLLPAPVVDHELVPGSHEVAGHGLTHDAKAYKSDLPSHRVLPFLRGSGL